MGSWWVEAMLEGMQLLRHARGNPDTELGCRLTGIGEAHIQVVGLRREPRVAKADGVADVLVVLRGRESLPHGEGGHGDT